MVDVRHLAERWKRIVRLKGETESRDRLSLPRKRGRRRAFYSILGGQDEIRSNLLNRNWFSTGLARASLTPRYRRLKWYATSFMIPWWGAVWVWYQMADHRTSHEAKRGFPHRHLERRRRVRTAMVSRAFIGGSGRPLVCSMRPVAISMPAHLPYRPLRNICVISSP